MKHLVLYHDDLDGWCSAWIAHSTLGDTAEYRAVQYDQPAPPEALDGRAVTILDFSYPRPDMLRIAAASARLVCLDHHQTTVDACRGIAGCEVDENNAAAGCVLTWEHYFDTRVEPIHDLVWAVDDRDRWQFRLPQTREICAALESYPRDFDTWDDLALRPIADLEAEGRPILRYMARHVERQVERAALIDFHGERVPALNATMLISEIGQVLASGHLFAAIWFRRADGRYVVSLRSRGGAADVAKIARAHGGGGHKHAAGFACDTLPWEAV